MTDESSPYERSVDGRRIKDLGLAIAGTSLEPVLAAFLAEMKQAGWIHLTPRFYLSNEWGVPMDTIAIAIPFYLAHPDLVRLHLRRTGLIEGFDAPSILRYLRHELGHVVNYAYKLYVRAEWQERFGQIETPYHDDYMPKPFDRRFVRHLPGWYGQKHPDEDWAETFAVWMTPGGKWRTDYAEWPVALAKLECCDRFSHEIASQPPLVTNVELDEDVGEMETTLCEFYAATGGEPAVLPTRILAFLRDAFADIEPGPPDASAAVADLLQRLRFDLCAAVFQWTGLAAEHVHFLVDRLAEHAASSNLLYRLDRESSAVISVTAMITSLATKRITDGSYDS